MSNTVQLSYFSDLLCVWAYVSQVRLDELKANFGTRIEIDHVFVNLFGNTQQRIGHGWADRGGYEGFHDHVMNVSRAFPHVEISPDIWTVCRPKSSAMGHLFFKSVQILEQTEQIPAGCVPEFAGRTIAEEFIWRVRCAFFADARDVGRISNLFTIAEEMRLPIPSIEQQIHDGAAIAALCSDLEKKDVYNIEGSPTYVLNEGRQKLYGNVGYRIIEANVLEFLERPEGQASWC